MRAVQAARLSFAISVLDGYLEGVLLDALADEAQASLEQNVHGMKPEEAAVTAFLRLRLREMADPLHRSQITKGTKAPAHVSRTM